MVSPLDDKKIGRKSASDLKQIAMVCAPIVGYI
jgi:hypothetical protein